MRQLMLESGMLPEAFKAYDQRLRLVEAVYQDRVRRKPEMPWDEARQRANSTHDIVCIYT